MPGHYFRREGGEVRPKRPTVGKEKPGITISGVKDGRDSEPTNRVNVHPGSAGGESQVQGSSQGSIVMRQKECRLSGCTCADR